MTDTQLVAECIQGNYRAQKALYHQHSGMMMGVAMRFSSCKSEAEDILQDSFITVFSKLEQFKNKGALGAWLRKIVVNTALMRIRKNKHIQLHIQLDESLAIEEVSEDALSKMCAKELMYKIQRLAPGFRTIFNLYAIEGYTHPEISQELGISVGTSKSQYSRARALLKIMIEKEIASEKAI